MSASTALSEAANGSGFLLVLAVSLPTAGMLLSVLGARLAARAAPILMLAGLGVAIAIVVEVWRVAQPLVYFVGGWVPPLGLALRADGLSAVMLATTAIVICATDYTGGQRFVYLQGCPRHARPWFSGFS